MKTKVKIISLSVLILLMLSSTKLSAQMGVLTGSGIATCSLFSFGVCPGQVITPLNYGTPPNWSCTGLPTTDVSFNILGSGWRVQTLWSFTTCSGAQLTGFNQFGTSVGPFLIPPNGTLIPVTYASPNGVNCIKFTINGNPIGGAGAWINQNTFSITVPPMNIIATNYTMCANSASCINITPTVLPNNGGPYTYTWLPGPGPTTGSNVIVCPTVTTVYTVCVSSRCSGTCVVCTTIAVTVSNCPTPSAGCCIGNYCNPIPNANPLTGDYNIPLGSNIYRFNASGIQGPTGGCGASDIVSVGYLCPQTPPSRFSVWDNQPAGNNCETYAGHFKSSNQPLSTSNFITSGVYAEAKGIQLSGITQNPPRNIGGLFEGWGTQKVVGACGRINKSSQPGPLFDASFPVWYAIGGSFMSDTITSNPVSNQNVNHIGVYGRGSNSSWWNFGVFGEVPSDLNNTMSTAIYGKTSNTVTGLGNNNWAGYFMGDVWINGNGYVSGGIGILSDKRFKKDIKKLESVTEKIKSLSGYSYNFRTQEFKDRNFSDKEQIGLIAQELKEVFPQLVYEDSKGYMLVNYQGMVPVLVEAIKEQQKQIDEKTLSSADVLKQLEEQKKINETLISKMDQLEKLINSCCSIGNEGAKTNPTIPVELSDKDVIVLNQNVPNPWAESTVITYTIPNDFSRAQIIFSTTDGKVIQTVDITTKGKGRLNVFANDLTNGMYSYTLIVDGKVIASKKMVKD